MSKIQKHIKSRKSKKFYRHYCVLSNVMNTVSDPISVCLVERNISVPTNFDVLFQGVSGF